MKPLRILVPELAVIAGIALLAACSDDQATADNVRQTGLPGHVAAGGSSSGEVMSRSDKTVADMPAGTPGIPEGSGGNTGGAALGGTVQTDGAKGGTGAPAPDTRAPTEPALRQGRGVTALNPDTATSDPNFGVGGAPESGKVPAPEAIK